MQAEHQRAWMQQAQLDAERGVITCRMCTRHAGLDETTTLWRNGLLVFALCDRCAASHHVVFSPKGDRRRGARHATRPAHRRR